MQKHPIARVPRLAAPKLPDSIQHLADKNYELLKHDPEHPSLHYKKVGAYRSVRVGIAYHAPGVEDGKSIVWF